MKLKDKIAIITGAGAGMGKATAILFAKEGAKICLNSQSNSAQDTADIIKKDAGEAIFVQGDISEPTTSDEIVKKTIETFGKIDILINNAGIVLPGRVDNMSIEDWDRTFAVNVRGVYLLSKACIPDLKKTKGVIIHNASVLAIKGVKERAAYSASKGAIYALTKAMAADYIEDGIRVACFLPGTTDTESLAKRIAVFDDPVKAKQDFIDRQPLKRLATSEEMAEAILYLATAGFLTGSFLSVDGGATI